MKAATSILSFPFVFNSTKNSHTDFISNDDFLTLLKQIANAVVEGKTESYSHFKIAVNGELVKDREKSNEMVKSFDYSSIENFKKSVTTVCGDSCLVYISGWNKLKTPITLALEKYLKEVLNLEDEVIETADYELFTGKYKKTYGGVHRAECSNLQYVISGHKTFSYWHPTENMGTDIEYTVDSYSHGKEEYLLSEPDTISDNEIVLEGKTGDVFYIPHSWWHVASSPDMSISITLALYHN